METIEDIVREMREQGKHNKENVDLDWLTEEVGDLQLRIADRVEAAVKHQFREVTKTIPHEEVAVAENATTTPTTKESLEVGNAAAMRKALEAVVKVGYPHNFQHEAPHISGYCYEITTAIEKCFAALSAPPRNCDRFDNEEDAFNEWSTTIGKNYKFGQGGYGMAWAFTKWLFAEAKGETND